MVNPIGILIGAVVVCFIRVLGFKSAGVAAGSIAAFIQSLIGNVAKGSLFAILQAIGAIGALIKLFKR